MRTTTVDGFYIEDVEIVQWEGIGQEPATSTVGNARIYFNPITGKLRVSEDGGEWGDLLSTSTADALYVKRDQSTPQSMTGLADGYLALESGVITSNVGPIASTNRAISFTFDGSGVAPDASTVAGVVVPYAGTITGWKIIEVNGVSSSIVLTIKNNGSAISGTEKPTLSSSSSNTDTSLTTWTTTISKGDVITATIDSASTGTRFNCVLYVTASS